MSPHVQTSQTSSPIGFLTFKDINHNSGMQNPKSTRDVEGDLTEMTVLSHVFALEKKFEREIASLHQEFEKLRLFRAAEKAKVVDDRAGVSRPPGWLVAGSVVKSTVGADGSGPVTPPSRWMPLAIRRLPCLDTTSLPHAQQPLPTPVDKLETFTASFLKSVLGGSEWSPGLFYSAAGSATRPVNKQLLPESKTYYMMDAILEPFLPTKPGEHGAKLSVFFNSFNEENGQYSNVPLFVKMGTQGDARAKGGVVEKQFTYLGNYSQLRWSDKLDFDRVAEVVPATVKRWWADLLAEKEGRPEWLETALMEAFWEKPKYTGDMPKDGEAFEGTMTEDNKTVTTAEKDGDGGKGKLGSLKADVRDYIEELQEWEKDAKMKVGLLRAENILEAFEREDAAEEPGIRFWWEYLQCVGFDRNFYYMLATAKKDAESGVVHSTTKSRAV